MTILKSTALDGYVTIEFEKTDGTYTLKDAIVLPDDHVVTDTEIEALKQKRFDDFLAIVTAPQPEIIEEVANNGE